MSEHSKDQIDVVVTAALRKMDKATGLVIKRAMQAHHWHTRDGRKAKFIAVLDLSLPAPLLFQVSGVYENYYLNGMHMLYPTEMDLVKTDFT